MDEVKSSNIFLEQKHIDKRMRYRRQQISPDEKDYKNSTYTEARRIGGTSHIIKPNILPKIAA